MSVSALKQNYDTFIMLLNCFAIVNAYNSIADTLGAAGLYIVIVSIEALHIRVKFRRL